MIINNNGSGMYNYLSSPSIHYTLFSGNYATGSGLDRGGAIVNSDFSAPVIINCTFTYNYARGQGKQGGAIFNRSSAGIVTIINSIIWGNSGPQIYDESIPSDISYSDVEGGYPGEGNINIDPDFIAPYSSNFHLKPTSPCIDAGNPSAIYDDPNSTRNDMGAYGGIGSNFDDDYDGIENWWEDHYGFNSSDPADALLDPDGDQYANVDEFSKRFDPFVANTIWYVDDSATGAATGLSWADAFNHPQDAVDIAGSGEWIWVAEGVYTSGTTEPVLILKDGVTIFGGFMGNETGLGQRSDPSTYPTVLDGENMSYHVVMGASNVHFDGFTIQEGNADGDGSEYKGGGLYNDMVLSQFLKNCNFNDNYSGSSGGAIFSNESSMNISNCTFTGNSTYLTGGAIYNRDYSSLYLANNTFTDNQANSFGGAIRNDYGSSTLVNSCTFINNQADEGGAVLNSSSSTLVVNNSDFSGNSADWGGAIHTTMENPNYIGYANTVKDCIFDGNSAIYQGGAIYSELTSSAFDKCTFKSNTAGQRGGAVYGLGSSEVITNSLFYDNIATNEGGAIYGAAYAADFINCTFSANSSASGSVISYRANNYDPFNIINDLPRIKNSILWGNIGAPISGDINLMIVKYSNVEGGYPGDGNMNVDPLFVGYPNFNLQSVSPCIDAADSVGAPSVDLAGTPRYSGLDYDMGAYEYWWGDQCNDGIDNDGDTLTDWPADPDCVDIADNSETYLECNDGLDNDGDTFIDWPGDVGCLSETDPSEYLGTQCDDGVDNDGNTLADWPDDASCLSISDDPESEAVWYVDDSAVGTGDGSSWADAFTHPMEAVSISRAGEDIWVAEGTYTPRTWDSIIEMKESVRIYGGFLGTEAWLSDRASPMATPSILNGGEPVVRGTSYARLDGFIIENGYAGDHGSRMCFDYCHGGGMINDSTNDLTVANCLFRNNRAVDMGGAMYNYYTHNTLVINTIFVDNRAEVEWETGCFSDPQFCEYGDASGGAVFNDSCDTQFKNCTFNSNSADFYGGAFYVVGMFIMHVPEITNSILWGDFASWSGNEIYNESYASTVTYSDVSGGYAGSGNINTNPLFVTGPNGDFFLSQIATGQGADSPCVDAGSAPASSVGMDDKTTRTDGVPDSGIVDMGFHYIDVP